MQLETKYFGDVEISENKVVILKQPIYGFEDLDKFVILSDTEIGNDIIWFQSVQEKHICFILANLQQVAPTYQPKLPTESLKLLNSETEEDLMFFAILVVGEEFKNSTANLKSPIVINPHNNYGLQVILDEDYSLKHRLFATEGSD